MDLIGVVGGGAMGAGIAEVAALAGCDVVVSEVDEQASRAARARLESSLARAVRAGRATSGEAERPSSARGWPSASTCWRIASS